MRRITGSLRSIFFHRNLRMLPMPETGVTTQICYPLPLAFRSLMVGY